MTARQNAPFQFIKAFIISSFILGSNLTIWGSTLKVPEQFKSIQAAIDASSEGDTILVQPGTYKETLKLKPGITLKSSGDDSRGKLGLLRAQNTIIHGQGKPLTTFSGITMAENSILDGFTITGMGPYDEKEWNRHHSTQGNEQKHSRIGHIRAPAVSIQGIRCEVKNNIVHHNGDNGIAIRGIEGKDCSPRISDNICYRNMGGGIGSTHGATPIIDNNHCFENFYAGIGQEHSKAIVINNTCYKNIRAGIGVGEGAEPIVRNNTCYQNRRAGIGIRSGSKYQPIISQNHCYENAMAGIGVRHESRPLISDNQCYKNKIAGIGIRESAQPIITGNKCFENERAGIGQRENAKTVLINNHCQKNKLAGIGFESCDSGSSTAVGNHLFENGTVAVGIHKGWKVHLIQNQLLRTGGLPPMIMVFEGAHANLIENNLLVAGVAGVRMAGSVTAIDNSIQGTGQRKGGPPHFAFWALPKATLKAVSNKVKNFRQALVSDRASVEAYSNIIETYTSNGVQVRNSNHPPIFIRNTFNSPSIEEAIKIQGSKSTVIDNQIKTNP